VSTVLGRQTLTTAMIELTEHLCFNHRGRDASARCPECRRFFCRECVTEHDDRVICASCLARLLEGATTKDDRPRARQRVSLGVQVGLGAFVLWLVFYSLGQILLRIPSQYHEGTLWRAEVGES
jgi:hypothetical protein